MKVVIAQSVVGKRVYVRRADQPAATCVSSIAIAQDEAEEAATENDVMDEIVVTAGKKPGDPVDVEALYEEMMRERLMIDIAQLRDLEEENAWRNSARTATIEEPSRISWGYKPQDDLRMGRGSNLSDVTFITTKPASLFQFEF